MRITSFPPHWAVLKVILVTDLPTDVLNESHRFTEIRLETIGGLPIGGLFESSVLLIVG